MNPTSSGDDRLQPVVIWIIWFALLSGMGFILVFVGGGWPSGEGRPFEATDPMFLVPLASWCAGMFVRWMILPQAKAAQAFLQASIVGMALCEAAMIIAIFALAEEAVFEKQILVVMAFLGVALFAPLRIPRSAA